MNLMNPRTPTSPGKTPFTPGKGTTATTPLTNRSTVTTPGTAQSKTALVDDIDCREWLEEIDMAQYAETFLANLSSDGHILLRSRLSTVRQQDLPKMGIRDFDHEKIIMEHIKLILKHPFNSVYRKKEVKVFSPAVQKKKGPTSGVIKLPDNKTSFKPPPIKVDNKKEPPRQQAEAKDAKDSDNKENKDSKDVKEVKEDDTKKLKQTPKAKVEERKKEAKRRRSFDSSVWQNIQNMRNKQSDGAAAANNLREGIVAPPTKPADSGSKEKSKNRRRWSFDNPNVEDDIINAKDKALAYGNMALEYDMMLTSLRTLYNDYLEKFKKTINCDRASIFFVHETTRELVLFASDGQFFRIAPGSGLAGYCAESGDSLNIPDVYKDYRFNRNLDLKTGYRTRNMLCHPVRRNRGGGAIVAVVEMMNKNDNQEFGHDDEEVLAACAQKVADVLSDRFKELQKCAERFSATATYISKGGTTPMGSGPSPARTNAEGMPLQAFSKDVGDNFSIGAASADTKATAPHVKFAVDVKEEK